MHTRAAGSPHEPQETHTGGAYLSLCGSKQLRVLLPPPPLDGTRLPPAVYRWYPCIDL